MAFEIIGSDFTHTPTVGAPRLRVTFTDASFNREVITETGSAPDTITESGSASDTITETGY